MASSYRCGVAPTPYDLHAVPELERPVFVVAFRGLFDMGEAATSAVDWLSMTHAGHPAAYIDPETLFDFQETRPEVRIGADGAREIIWPANNAVWAKTPDGCRDLVLLSGVEPNLRWRSFGETLAEIIDRTGCELVVTLGSTLAMAPHTRAFPVKASTVDPDLATRLGVAQPTYEGPTGLIGSLHQQLAGGPPMLSLRVSIPHYVPGAPSPKATAALLFHLERLTGIATEHASMADEIRDWERRVHQALADDEDVRAYVEQLETDVDAQPVVDLSVDGLDDATEAFLRERNED